MNLLNYMKTDKEVIKYLNQYTHIPGVFLNSIVEIHTYQDRLIVMMDISTGFTGNQYNDIKDFLKVNKFKYISKLKGYMRNI